VTNLVKATLVIFLSLILSAYNYCLDSRCVGCWYMESSATETDESGNNETLSESAGDDIPASATKKFGTYSRDWENSGGENEYLYHADGGSTDLNGANQDIVILTWVRVETDNGAINDLVSKYDYGDGNKQFDLRADMSDDTFMFRLSNDGSSNNDVYGEAVVTAGTWVHLVGYYDDSGSDLTCYYDNTECGSPASYTGGMYDGNEIFSVGMYWNSGTAARPYDGLMDDIAVFDEAITTVELGDIYNYGLKGRDRRIIVVRQAEATRLWKKIFKYYQ